MMHSVGPRFGAARRLRLLVLIVAIGVASGCAGAKKMRQAQDYFSQAAALENEAKLIQSDQLKPIDPANPLPEPGLDASLGANALYQRALDALESMSRKELASLEKDQLIVTKQTLEAMCQWRLGNYGAARSIADEAVTKADRIKEPRDRALLVALPGLIKNDQAYQKIPEKKTAQTDEANFKQIENLLVGSDGALQHIDDARGEAAGRPVDVYLIQCELAVYKNLRNAIGKLKIPSETFDTHRDEVIALLRELLAHKADDLANVWRIAFGIAPLT